MKRKEKDLRGKYLYSKTPQQQRFKNKAWLYLELGFGFINNHSGKGRERESQRRK